LVLFVDGCGRHGVGSEITGNYITVQDIETGDRSHRGCSSPYNASKGAGGDFNFANKNGDLILMVQKMAGRKMYESNKSQTRKSRACPRLGDEAFIDPPATIHTS